MKRKLVSLILLIVLTLALTPICYAAGNISESPEIKININGQISSYTDVPIIVNGRSLLPLREILINLGIQNDNEHIIWDAQNNSVTVYKDTLKLYLEVGNKVARVGDNEEVLDTPPVIYKNRVYIPSRFVAQSLGEKVVWDKSMNMIIIRDEIEFNSVKRLLEKVETEMKSVTKFKSEKSGVLSIDKNNLKLTYDIKVAVQVDIKKMEWYGEAKKTEVTPDGKSTTLSLQFYMKNKTTYARILPNIKWEKTEVKTGEGYSMDFLNYMIKPDDINSAGLIIQNANSIDEIILKGKINLDDPLNSFMDLVGVEAFSLSDADVEISIDKNTFLINKVILKIGGNIPSQNGTKQASAVLNYTFKEYNGNFEIVKPDNLE